MGFMKNGSLHPGGLRLTDRAARLAGVSDGMKVADVGCGNGASLVFLKSKYDISAVGFDVSEEQISAAKTAAPGSGIEFVCCGAEGLLYAKDSVDIAFCECTLSDVSDPKKALKQIRGLLHTGGKLVLSDIYAKTSSAAPWTKAELTDMIEAAGYVTLTVEDHTSALVTYAAERYGSGRTGLGYVLVTAERRDA